MDARLLSGNAEVAVLPRGVGVTTLGAPDPVWRDFETNVTGAGSIPPPVAEKGEQQLLYPVEATGPSEVSVWPYVPDARVAASPICRDAAKLGTPDRVWRDFESEVPAVGWVLLPAVEKGKQRLLHAVAATGPSQASVWPSVLDMTEDGGDGIAILEISAETGDETGFVQAASEIDWSQRPAADFARAVRLALAAGAHLLARKLADCGHRLYPHYEELAKMAHTLAPPRVVRTDIPPVPSLQANQAWLRAHGDEYRGQWVALRDGILLAAAATARQLQACLESTDDALITKVF
ncbi:MAG: hypothetical protein ACETWR_18560 [Anaerolineae bacterium]